jgi:hypothetical protein
MVTMSYRMCSPGDNHFEDLFGEEMRLQLRMYRIDEERAEF